MVSRLQAFATASCDSSCPHCVKSLLKKRYGHPGMKSMNSVLKCSGRQGNMAHPLWMHCCHGLSCPYCCWAGPGNRQALHSISRSRAAGTCFCSEQVGEQLPHTAAHHVPAPLPRLLCSFFIARSFCLGALLPALKIGPPGAKDELCKWKQQIELSLSRGKQGITAALGPKKWLLSSNSPFLERSRLYRSPV